jgi:hypothetical protein
MFFPYNFFAKVTMNRIEKKGGGRGCNTEQRRKDAAEKRREQKMQMMRGGEGNYFRKQMAGTMGNKWGNLKIS